MSKKNQLTIALFLLCCLLLTACAPIRHSALCVKATDGDSISEGPFLTNPRFEPFNSMNLVPSNNYWGLPNEKFAVKFDKFEFLETDVGATCNFSSTQTLPAGCRRCDYCSSSNTCPPPIYVSDDIKPSLAIYDGSMLTDAPTAIETLTQNNACSTNWTEQTRKVITLTKNTTYEIRDAQTVECESDFNKRKTVASLTVKVVSGDGQNADFGMKPLTEPSQPQIAFFGWSTEPIPEIDPITGNVRERWTDNFNSALRATKAKVVIATKGDDNLEDNPPLRPTRLIFVQGFNPAISLFSQDDLFCSPASDNSFDLSQCNSNLTPTYMTSNVLGRLTWFAEFNPAGSAVPVFNPETEEIKVVFTIK